MLCCYMLRNLSLNCLVVTINVWPNIFQHCLSGAGTLHNIMPFSDKHKESGFCLCIFTLFWIDLTDAPQIYQVTNYLETMIFFLNKLLWGPMKVKFRHLWLRWSLPNVLAYLNFWCTMGHPLVAKFSNMCYFHHLLRCPRKTWPKSTGLPWKI